MGSERRLRWDPCGRSEGRVRGLRKRAGVGEQAQRPVVSNSESVFCSRNSGIFSEIMKDSKNLRKTLPLPPEEKSNRLPVPHLGILGISLIRESPVSQSEEGRKVP